MAPLCEGICRRRRLRGVSKGNTQKNHETRESILRTDFAGLGERDGKSAENGLQNRFSSTKNSLQHAVRKCENQKSYPHSCAQMWVNSADNSWITHYFVVENSCITATSMWKTQIRRTGCGKLAHLSTSHAEFVHNFQGLMTVAVVGLSPTYPHYPPALLWRLLTQLREKHHRHSNSRSSSVRKFAT